MTREDDFEGLLAECVTRVELEGPAALEDMCARHPAVAQRLRDSVERLRSVGLLADSSAASLPERIGAYTITARLGRGGMGVVYLARDPSTGSPVAIKMGPAPLEPGDRATARFEREMRTLTGIAHANLVRVLDVGSVDGRPYYTMDFVAGATVAEILDALRASGRGLAARDAAEAGRVVRAGIVRIAPDVIALEHSAFSRTWIEFACRIVLDAARALAHLHELGIVHRDVKPANIIVDGEGRARVFDLGLAHVDDEPRITRTGDFAGTPHYIAPEVARGSAKSATPRSDVFALGVTLFEMLTLRPPFDGPNAAQVLAAIAERDAPSPRRIDPELPRDLETICATALEKDPARRYASMDELAADLERFLAFRPVQARPVGALERAWRFTKRRPALASAIGLAALIAVGLPIGLAIANRSIRVQRDRAEFAAKEALSQVSTSRRVTDFLVDLFRSSGQKSESMRAAEILERGSRQADGDFKDRPLVRAALLEALGRVYSSFGDKEKAVALLDRSLAIRQSVLGEHHVDTARTIHSIGVLHLERDDVDAALALFERALAAWRTSDFAPETDEVVIRASLGAALLRARDPAAAIPHLERALSIWRDDTAIPSAAKARAFEHLGSARSALGSHDAAAESFEAAYVLLRSALVPDFEARHRVLTALSDVRRAQGLDAEAERLLAEAGVAPTLQSIPLSTWPGAEWTSADSKRLLELFQPRWRADYERDFQHGITALQSGDFERASSAFAACLALRPRDAVCAYNMACVRALARDHEGALTWFEQSAEFGAGRSTVLLHVAETDRETEGLRSTSRGAATLARMRSDAALGTPPSTLVLPTPEGPDASVPLVVVLRDGERATPNPQAVDWFALAPRLGFALLLPTPPNLSGEDREPRAVWVDSVADFSNRPWVYEEPVFQEITRALENRVIDRNRVFLAGEHSGAWIAFDLACRAPGIIRGALLVEGPFHPALSLDSAMNAAASGSRMKWIRFTRGDTGGADSTLIEMCRHYFADCGFAENTVLSCPFDPLVVDTAMHELETEARQRR